MDKTLLKQYANMAVNIGINIQKGQTLIIRAPITGAEFARECAVCAYDSGARDVVIDYNDEKFRRIRMDRAAKEALCDIKPSFQNSRLEYVQSQGTAAFLSIISEDPEIYKGLDMEKIDAAAAAQSKALTEFRDYTMNSRVQWCVVAIPSEGWAAKVFPQLSVSDGVEKLWETIFKVSRVAGNAKANWKKYTDAQWARREKLNEYGLTEIHMTSKNGTDLVVGLAEDCVWGGGKDFTTGGRPYTKEGVEFIANMPTEEIFTAPHKDRVNGVVYGTKPYVYNGNLIKDFVVTFKDGKVVDFDAKSGKELLGQLLKTDEGAMHIGEIALVPASSPINVENVLFYNTLFDENAACHIAFGAAYPDTVKGGSELNRDELSAKGVNYSLIHEDVMVGAQDTNITGKTKTGQTVEIFRNGEWMF
ncbi:MAG: aminopeptidase [Oscillospiraceae bacterium]